jgi:hypothetical protein
MFHTIKIRGRRHSWPRLRNRRSRKLAQFKSGKYVRQEKRKSRERLSPKSRVRGTSCVSSDDGDDVNLSAPTRHDQDDNTELCWKRLCMISTWTVIVLSTDMMIARHADMFSGSLGSLALVGSVNHLSCQPVSLWPPIVTLSLLIVVGIQS